MFRYVLISSLLIMMPLAAGTQSPYAGEEGRRVKALSAEQAAELLDGKGMGYALAAELNGYPGPLHVIELSEKLLLTDGQHEQTQALFARMRNAARAIGREIVDAEAALDRRFAAGDITADELRSSVSRIALLQGRLRVVHLGAHLEQAALLSEDQVEAYATLRGYGHGTGNAGQPHSSHHQAPTDDVR